MDEWTIFGERLKSELTRQGMSNRAFADKTGITTTTVCRYANSKRIPRASEILKAANALGVTCDYLVGLSDERYGTINKPERKKGKCAWCSSPYRIEYYWIDRDGNTASFQDEERHLVATGIANFCPNCGSDMRGEQE